MKTLYAMLGALLLSLPASAAGRIESRDTTLADIRQYYVQLLLELDEGRLRTVPARIKTALRARVEALEGLMASPTAAVNETELGEIGTQFVQLQDAAEAATLQVVVCKRVAHVASRIGKLECMTVAERERLRELSRHELAEATWSKLPEPD